MLTKIPRWEGSHFVSDQSADTDGFYGSVYAIFKTIGNEDGTPIIQTGWECMVVKSGRSFIMWNCVEEVAKKAVEGFVCGEFSIDML